MRPVPLEAFLPPSALEALRRKNPTRPEKALARAATVPVGGRRESVVSESMSEPESPVIMPASMNPFALRGVGMDGAMDEERGRRAVRRGGQEKGE